MPAVQKAAQRKHHLLVAVWPCLSRTAAAICGWLLVYAVGSSCMVPIRQRLAWTWRSELDLFAATCRLKDSAMPKTDCSSHSFSNSQTNRSMRFWGLGIRIADSLMAKQLGRGTRMRLLGMKHATTRLFVCRAGCRPRLRPNTQTVRATYEMQTNDGRRREWYASG